MESQRKTKSGLFQLLGIVTLFLAFGMSGCDGISTKGGSSGCTGASAQINVYDSQVSRVCGCTEGVGTFTQPGSFTCTVKIGTTVYFSFIGISNTHIITTAVGNTSPIGPTDAVKTAAILMNVTGSINVYDNADTNFSGTFTVTP